MGGFSSADGAVRRLGGLLTIFYGVAGIIVNVAKTL